ncbi:MAG TPA: hybrid sensor histidine kinase/response regulator, partial [Stenotrophomonas sp.]|nr:hybrid sensor histidine kinase/response regulator [Stenotrophomonas sp.]
MLDFSRLDPGRPQLLDAASTVAAMAPMLQQVFDDSVQCRVATDGARSQIHFDPAQLESILLSLAVNAQQAMPEGGRFDLTLLDLPGSGELLIRVGDTGHGMSAD